MGTQKLRNAAVGHGGARDRGEAPNRLRAGRAISWRELRALLRGLSHREGERRASQFLV